DRRLAAGRALTGPSPMTERAEASDGGEAVPRRAVPMPRVGSPGRVGPVLQEVTQGVFVEDRDSELLGLRQLRSRARAHHDVARLLRHAVRDLAAARLQLGLGL